MHNLLFKNVHVAWRGRGSRGFNLEEGSSGKGGESTKIETGYGGVGRQGDERV